MAACADHHFLVAKAAKGGVTSSDVQPIHGEARTAEIARMLGGERLSSTSLAHAQEMLAHSARALPPVDDRSVGKAPGAADAATAASKGRKVKP